MRYASMFAAALAALMIAAPSHAGVLEIAIPVSDADPTNGFTYVDSIGGIASGVALNNGPGDFNVFGNVFQADYGLLGAADSGSTFIDYIGSFTASATSGAGPFLDATLISSFKFVTLGVNFVSSGSSIDVIITNVTTGGTKVIGDLDPTMSRTSLTRVFDITSAIRTLGEGQYTVTFSYKESGTRRTYFGFNNVQLTIVTP
ncbi:MAG: hypothetical protein KME03_04865 [Aphanocapsa lilacina HA4352-LM1]|nr:hypothetical protein [Aphanocapsa lilacina HA4352-LM1]